MEKYFSAFVDSFIGTSDWVWRNIIFEVPWYNNYFWGLMIISIAVWGLEMAFPWRKNQSFFRKDFWLDGFYMYFNFFIFSIVIAGVYKILELGFSDLGIGENSLAVVDTSQWPVWLQLLVFFIVLDFVQWFTHVLLHRYDFLWKFHKVHHSVIEMGFSAHLRYHWMENVFYKPLKTLGVMVLGGFEPEQAYMVHFFAITIGHLNHCNVNITWGPLKYILNSSTMHIWHHAYHLPKGREHGMNFGISLSIWDYIFKTAEIPSDGRDIELGFPGVEKFPENFAGQLVYGFGKEEGESIDK